MNIKINDKKYTVKPLSQLSVLEYVQIVDKARYIDLISYISALVGFEIDSANVKMNNIDIAERILLDADIDFSKIKTPNIFEYNKETHIVNAAKSLEGIGATEDMDSGTFGNKYMFNLYRRQFENKDISIAALCVYALAIVLSKEPEYADIDTIYYKLLEMNWQVILPIGFFLSKKLSNRRNFLMIFLRTLIVRLLYLMRAIRMRATHTT